MAGLPSFYLAHTLVAEELFSSNARQLVRREFAFESTFVSGVEISPGNNQIELTLIGDPVAGDTLSAIRERLPDAGLAGAALVVNQAGDHRVDITSLKAGIVSDLFREGLQTSNLKDEEIARLRADLTRLAAARVQSGQIALELKAQYPQFEEIMVGEGVIAEDGPAPSDVRSGGAAAAVGGGPTLSEKTVLIVSARSDRPLESADRERIEAWLQVRAKSADVRLVVQVTTKMPEAPDKQTPAPTTR